LSQAWKQRGDSAGTLRQRRGKSEEKTLKDKDKNKNKKSKRGGMYRRKNRIQQTKGKRYQRLSGLRKARHLQDCTKSFGKLQTLKFLFIEQLSSGHSETMKTVILQSLKNL
jgi:hypothetical protein